MDNYLVFNQEEILDPNFFIFFLDKLTETYLTEIDQNLKSNAYKRRLLQKFGNKCFFDNKFQYLIINPDTGKYDCKLIRKAYYNLLKDISNNKTGARDLLPKMKELIKDNKCSSNLSIKLENVGLFDIDDIINLYM